jgi:hypothetical protein
MKFGGNHISLISMVRVDENGNYQKLTVFSKKGKFQNVV